MVFRLNLAISCKFNISKIGQAKHFQFSSKTIGRYHNANTFFFRYKSKENTVSCALRLFSTVEKCCIVLLSLVIIIHIFLSLFCVFCVSSSFFFIFFFVIKFYIVFWSFAFFSLAFWSAVLKYGHVGMGCRCVWVFSSVPFFFFHWTFFVRCIASSIRFQANLFTILTHSFDKYFFVCYYFF